MNSIKIYYNKSTGAFVDSANVRYIVVEELPAITVAGMRTEAEEIDGRDGEILRELGRAAYDKAFRVGLRPVNGSIDLGAVVDFFAHAMQPCYIVYSNEPNYYYRSRLIQQVDLERLLRFRRATFAMRTEPYKYSLLEMLVPAQVSIITPTGSGTFPVTNGGNVYSAPKIEIRGKGVVNVFLAENQLFSITFDADNYEAITIDCENMEATFADGSLANRRVIGDYSLCRIPPGEQVISWDGYVSQVQIWNLSRWL